MALTFVSCKLVASNSFSEPVYLISDWCEIGNLSTFILIEVR